MAVLDSDLDVFLKDSAGKPQLEQHSWSRLDNAGKLFPSIASSRATTYFRLSVTFLHDIDPVVLQRALATTLPFFKAFRVRLVRGLFWYSLAPCEVIPVPLPEQTFPCMPVARRFKTPLLFRVRWWKKRLSVEFSHALTDGTGGMIFLTSLAATYAGLAFVPPESGQIDDAFQALREKGYPRSKSWSPAFHVPFPLLPKGEYVVVTGTMALEAVKKLAVSLQMTLTEYVCAVYLAAFQDVFEALEPAQRRRLVAPIRIVIPINLRKFFPSPTLRNFFAVFPVEIDPSLGHYSFEEICHKVKGTFQVETDIKLIRKQVARNLRGEMNPVARLSPLIFKNLFLGRAFFNYERQYTSSLSNLGALPVTEGLAELLSGADFVPPPNPFTKVHCGVVSLRGNLSITVGRLMNSSAVERAFFGFLRRQGVAVRLITNQS
jgi:hypothetical protein